MEFFNYSEYKRVALLEVDVQKDFCPGGSLPVEDGDQVTWALNRAWMNIYIHTGRLVRLLPEEFWDYDRPHNRSSLLVATRDWHPPVTKHFGSPPDYQSSWPVHCVQGTPGAEFHPRLELFNAVVVSKGTQPDVDEYSGFDGKSASGRRLNELIGDPIAQRTAVVVGGLATDHCVRATVLDSLNYGYETFVLKDAIRGVNPDRSEEAIEEMKAAGARFIYACQLDQEY